MLKAILLAIVALPLLLSVPAKAQGAVQTISLDNGNAVVDFLNVADLAQPDHHCIRRCEHRYHDCTRSCRHGHGHHCHQSCSHEYNRCLRHCHHH